MSEDIRSTIQKRDDKGVVRHGGEWLAIWSDPDSVKTDAEKREESAHSQALRRIEASIAATARSMSQQSVEVVFGTAGGGKGQIALPALSPDRANLASLRGECDARASLILHHDPELHTARLPADPTAARLFTLVEQVRCEALEAREFPGVIGNLVAYHYERLRRAQLLNAHLASLIPLSEAVRMVCRDIFLDASSPSIETAGFRMWDRWLRDRYSPALAAMSKVAADQNSFASAAQTFVEDLLLELPSAGERQRRTLPDRPDAGHEGDTDQLLDANDPTSAPIFEPGELETGDPLTTTATTLGSTAEPVPYHVFSAAHDRVVYASELAEAADLRHARQKLDSKQSEYRQEVTRLVARLQRRLLALQARSWEFDLDEGLIDAAKLGRVVTNPGFEHAFKQESDSPFRDTVVTLLIDNSGSMRGEQVETACVVADLLAAALERCAITTEILGFTTSAWKGGQSYKDWLRAGKPDNPGRLNDLLHIIYKDASTPLRRARDAICAMLSPALLKENIDGEALQWAAERLLARPEERKILIVLSDGAPVDQATLERNEDKAILDRHLRQVVSALNDTSLLELCAIGIKHDVSSYYQVSQRIDRVADLAEAVVDILDTCLIAGPRNLNGY